MASLAGKTILMSGGSRGIGLAIALRAARDGANVAMIAKTDQPHPKLAGTIYTAAQQVNEAGGRALPVVGDIRYEDQVFEAVALTYKTFGGIDIVLNNASAIDLSSTSALSMKGYDLMQDINCRGSFLLAKACIPALRESAQSGREPHILTLSPPINLAPRWAGAHLGYTIAKYGMSLTTLGLSEELKGDGVAVHSLWPRTTIATAAIMNMEGGDTMAARARKPDIMADAAHAVLTGAPAYPSGAFLIDDEVLADIGVSDLSVYRYADGDIELPLDSDAFL
jgi:citronellol/citronellal dehydrogenase